MITGTTKSGFAFEIADSIRDDYEVLEIMTRVQKNDFLAIVELVDRVLGTDQKDAFKEHCRGEDGRVSTERMMTEFFEIFTANDATKK